MEGEAIEQEHKITAIQQEAIQQEEILRETRYNSSLVLNRKRNGYCLLAWGKRRVGYNRKAPIVAERPDQTQTLRRGNPTLEINTNRNRANSPKTGLKGSHILDAFLPPPNPNEANIQRELRSSSLRLGMDVEETAHLVGDFEHAEQQTRDGILEGHLDKVFNVAGCEDEPLLVKESAKRKVKVKVINGQAPRGMSAEFNGVDVEEEKVGRMARIKRGMQNMVSKLGWKKS